MEQEIESILEAVDSFFCQLFSYQQWKRMNNLKIHEHDFERKILDHLQSELGNKTGELLFDALFEQ